MRDEMVYKRLTEKELTDINTAYLRPVSQNF